MTGIISILRLQPMIKKISYRIVCFGWCWLAGTGMACAQEVRMAGLAENAEYTRLLREQEMLKACEDSTLSLIEQNRRLFEEGSDRERVGGEIVRLESELFDVRSKIGKVAARVAAMEQTYLIEHMDNEGEAETSVVTGERTLFDNPFFVENLSRNDRTLFGLSPRIEPEVMKINRLVSGLYDQLLTVKRQYEAAGDEETIDSLWRRSGELKEQIEQVDALMERLWLVIYDRKRDNYPVLVDQIGTLDRLQLEQLDRESRQVRRAEGWAGEQLAPLVATYPLQKQLMLDYEIAMAEALELTAARDSLATERGKYSAEKLAEEMTYRDIRFEPRSLVVYAPITKAGEGESRNYTTVADIPTLHVPKAGIYYTVQIANYATAPKSIDVFKGMTPIMSQKATNGQWRYMAGGFDTYAAASAAAAQMVRGGFRATVVAYADGKITTPAKAKTLEATKSTAGGGEDNNSTASAAAGRQGRFHIEIIPAEQRLSTAIREIVKARATGTTIVRSTVGNDVVYTIGAFATRKEAEALIGALGDQPNIKMKIVTL